LVTGATGRVGRHLVKALLDRGESVRVLVKNGTADSELVEVFYGDILNKESLRKAVDGVDTIYHLAAVVDYTAPKDLMFNVNVIGTKNLLEVSTGRKIIYLSSAAVMGRNFKELPVSESTPCSIHQLLRRDQARSGEARQGSGRDNHKIPGHNGPGIHRRL
jgi:nucleoside-diphosphate-sugar epimerase